MKKIMLSLGLMLGALTLTNCSNEIDENINTNTDGVAFELTTAIDADRTVANDFKTTWAADDAINLFHAVAGATTYTNNGAFAIAEEDLANGRFTGTLKEELTAEAYDWYAFYPYSSDYTTPAGTRYYKLWQQTQTVAANSTAHVVGLNGPLYGVAENVAVGEPVKVQMHQLGSLLRVKVGNESGDDFVIQSINVAAANTYITGSFYVGFNKDGVSRCEMSGASYAYKDVTLNIADEYTIADGDDAGDHCFYAAVAPFTAPEGGETLTITIVTDKGTYETTKAIPAGAEFASGVVNSLVITVEAVAEIIKEFPYTETFADNLGDFTIDDVAVGSLSTIWNYDTYGYMKGTGYKAGAATEGWLISPYVDLTGAANPVLRFDHAGNFFGSQANMINAVSVYVREADGEWAALTIPVYPNGTSWTFVNSDDIALSAYIGKTVQFGFKYTSPASGSIGTWEIKNVEVCEAPFSMSATAPAEFANTAATGSFDLTVKNAEGYTFTAALKDDSQTWISNIAVASNTVTFDVAANTGNARIAAIVVTATNGTNTETIEVAISQAASASAAQTTKSATITFDDKSKMTTSTTSQQVWKENNITVTYDKASYNNNLAEYAKPVRFYKGTKLTISAPGEISMIVFDCNSNDYATTLNNTISGSSVSSDKVTLVLNSTSSTYSFSLSVGQVRMDSMTITYLESSESGDEPAEPVQLVMSDVTCSNAGQSENSLTFTWSAVENASGYEVYFDSVSKGTVTDTSYTASGLAAGSEHVIAVKAVGDGTNYTTSEAKTCAASTKAASADDDNTGSTSTKSVTLSGSFTSANSQLTLTTEDGLTVTQYKQSGNTAVNATYGTATTLRVYKGHALKFSGKTITKIEIVCNGSYFGNSLTANVGTLATSYTSGGTHVWTGESNEVIIANTGTAANVQLRPSKIIVTYAE